MLPPQGESIGQTHPLSLDSGSHAPVPIVIDSPGLAPAPDAVRLGERLTFRCGRMIAVGF